MSTILHTEIYKGYSINIHPDDDARNPRDDDNLGAMVCFHRRYNLGDKHDWKTPEDFEAWATKQKGLIRLPLYLYDHSGLTISTTPFNCHWDSGQVGWIYITAEKRKDEYGAGRLTATLRKMVEAVLVSEVKVYDLYLTGSFVGYTITDPQGEETDSCWGIDDQEYAITEAKQVVEHCVKEDAARNTRYCVSLQHNFFFQTRDAAEAKVSEIATKLVGVTANIHEEREPRK